MLTNQRSSRSSVLAFFVVLAAMGVGIVAGFLAGAKPFYLVLAVVAVTAVVCLFTNFEFTVLGLLILRSSLDPFSAQQLPAAFALGVDALTLLYVTVLLLTKQRVQTNTFFWIFTLWVALQGLWVVLPALGLGLGTSYLSFSIREWLRIFSWLMVYLLVMQLHGRIHPQKVISTLFLSLIVPLIVGFMQLLLPSRLPYFLACSCLNSTIGHPSAFGTFLFLFIGLTLWKLEQVRQRGLWIILLATLAFFLVMTKSFTSLVIFCVFIVALTAPKLNLLKLIGGVMFLSIVLGFFANTPFGQEKLSAILDTPLFNPDTDISRTLMLAVGEGANSANWRIAQWTYLFQAWQKSPLLGYGLGTSPYLTTTMFIGLYAHNDYMRFLTEQGIVGLLIVLSFFVAQFFYLFQLLRNSPPGSPKSQLCLTLIAILTGIILGMPSDNVWSHTTLFFYWWLLFAVASWDWEQLEDESL